MTNSKFSVKQLSFCAIFVAIMAICSWISIPTTVPFTLQTFAVFLAIGLLGGKLGTIAVSVYVLLGAIGIPVFQGFTGGLGIISGATGGYIVGFIFSALIMWLIQKLFGDKLIIQIISMVAGLLVCYLFGTIWFMAVYTHNTGAIGLSAVLGWCVVPFIIPDAVKIACAVIIVNRLKKYVHV